MVLRIVKPKGNSQLGKLTLAQDLKRQLLRDVRNRHREELQVLAGKRIKISRILAKKRRASNQKCDAILGRYIDRPLKLRGTHKGVVYRARVRRSGWIFYNELQTVHSDQSVNEQHLGGSTGHELSLPDTNFVRVTEAWPQLPKHIKFAILALIDTTTNVPRDP